MKRLLFVIGIFVLCCVVNVINYNLEDNSYHNRKTTTLLKHKPTIDIYKEINIPNVSLGI